MHRTIDLTGIDLSGMKTIRTFITYIAALLSVATAVLSCSVGIYDTMSDMEGELLAKRISITGSVCSRDGQLLEDVAITFKSYIQNDIEAAPINTETVYSNSKGEFSILSEGADVDLFCIVTAEDPNGVYESQTCKIVVSWEGVSFDRLSNTYVVNDCNFVLNRK